MATSYNKNTLRHRYLNLIANLFGIDIASVLLRTDKQLPSETTFQSVLGIDEQGHTILRKEVRGDTIANQTIYEDALGNLIYKDSNGDSITILTDLGDVKLSTDVNTPPTGVDQICVDSDIIYYAVTDNESYVWKQLATEDELSVFALTEDLADYMLKNGKGGYLAKTGNWTLDSDDDMFLDMDATSGNKIVYIPTAIGCEGKPFTIKKTDSTANKVTITTFVEGQKIDGEDDFILYSQYDSVTIYSDGANWKIAKDYIQIPEGTPVNGVEASKILTLSSNASNNETVTIGDKTYTFQISISETGAKASKLLTFGGQPQNNETVSIDGIEYSFKTNLTEAKSTGTLTLTGVASDGERVVIDGRIYELDADSSITGDVAVDISGGTKTQASGTLEITDVVIGGETFTIGTTTFEFDAGQDIPEGNIPIDITSSMVQSQGTLTLGGANPSQDDTVTIGTMTYTYTSTITNQNDVLIGMNVDDSLENLIYAINHGIGAGVLYHADTPANPDATAEKISATEGRITAIVYGTIGDTIATTETFTDNDNEFDGATLGTTTAGADCSNTDAIDTIDAFDFSFFEYTSNEETPSTVSFTCTALGIYDGSIGNSLATTEDMANGSFGDVTMTGGSDATASETVTAIVTAITNDPSAVVTAVDGAGDTVDLTAKEIGVNAYTTTETMANGSFGGATMTGGAEAVANEVKISAVNLSATIDNMVACCTGGAGEGTTYSTGSEAQTDTDITKQSATEVLATASEYGEGGNSIAIAETLSNGSWAGGSLFLSGGETPEAENDVLIGNDAEATIDNLVAAITYDGGAGTNEGVKYGTGTTANEDATAVKSSASTMTATALTKGTAGNSIAIAETLSNGSWAGGSVFLSGGVNGTLGRKGDARRDDTYLYICIDDNTTADANWRRIALGSAY